MGWEHTLLAACAKWLAKVREEETFIRTRMFVLKLGQVVHVLINYNVEVVGFVVGCHIGSCECLGHDADNNATRPQLTEEDTEEKEIV